MRDVEQDPDDESAYECFECGTIAIAEANPQRCAECGGRMRNRGMPIE